MRVHVEIESDLANGHSKEPDASITDPPRPFHPPIEESPNKHSDLLIEDIASPNFDHEIKPQTTQLLRSFGSQRPLYQSHSLDVSLTRACAIPMMPARTSAGPSLPNAYATVELRRPGDTPLELHTHIGHRTNVVGQDSNPKWDKTCGVSACTDGNVKLLGSLYLAVKVWHKYMTSMALRSLDGTPAITDEANDILIGAAQIELSPLTLGFPDVAGWYHLYDFSGDIRGQIYVAISPNASLREAIRDAMPAPAPTSTKHVDQQPYRPPLPSPPVEAPTAHSPSAERPPTQYQSASVSTPSFHQSVTTMIRGKNPSDLSMGDLRKAIAELNVLQDRLEHRNDPPADAAHPAKSAPALPPTQETTIVTTPHKATDDRSPTETEQPAIGATAAGRQDPPDVQSPEQASEYARMLERRLADQQERVAWRLSQQDSKNITLAMLAEQSPIRMDGITSSNTEPAPHETPLTQTQPSPSQQAAKRSLLAAIQTPEDTPTPQGSHCGPVPTSQDTTELQPHRPPTHPLDNAASLTTPTGAPCHQQSSTAPNHQTPTITVPTDLPSHVLQHTHTHLHRSGAPPRRASIESPIEASVEAAVDTDTHYDLDPPTPTTPPQAPAEAPALEDYKPASMRPPSRNKAPATQTRGTPELDEDDAKWQGKDLHHLQRINHAHQQATSRNHSLTTRPPKVPSSPLLFPKKPSKRPPLHNGPQDNSVLTSQAERLERIARIMKGGL